VTAVWLYTSPNTNTPAAPAILLPLSLVHWESSGRLVITLPVSLPAGQFNIVLEILGVSAVFTPAGGQNRHYFFTTAFKNSALYDTALSYHSAVDMGSPAIHVISPTSSNSIFSLSFAICIVELEF
jgi:hypothetical protein